MRRRRLLAVLPLTVLTVVRCGGSGEQAVVRVTTRPALDPEPGTNGEASATPVQPPEILTSTDETVQGGTVRVSVIGDLKEGSVTLYGRTLRLNQGLQSIYAFVGIAPEDPAGVQDMRIDFTLSTGSRGSLTVPITVRETEWTVDSITVGANLTALLNPRTQADELAAMTAVYSNGIPERYWGDAWLMPTGGAITTRFGEQRSYNGSEVGGHHSGTDLGAPAGTAVGATNHGRVVLSRQLRLRGNTVVVDHGGGVLSGYAHMASLAVAEGEAVSAGDTVGFVGTTGLSTGAHLHWEMAAGGVLVDAVRFTDGTNGF